MILNSIRGFVQNLREKIKNPFVERNSTPFAGAFIAALLIYNWQLFFSLISFDEDETRLSKIKIIQNYLAREAWYLRVLNPLILSFASIIFFYFFNNVSLAITTFFNRWFKGYILYWTDRSKIITRAEFESVNFKHSALREKYENLRRDHSDFELERDKIEKQLIELTADFSRQSTEFEKVKSELEIKSLALNDSNGGELKIKFARYGIEDVYQDVTIVVLQLLSKRQNFIVENSSLGSDPAKYSIKELFIVYEVFQKTKTILATEGQVVEIRDGEVIALDTEVSLQKQRYINNQKKLKEIFTGEWILTYSKNNSSNSEKVFIDDSGRYFVNHNHAFNLKTIMLYPGEGRITFNKITRKRIFHSREELNIINKSLVTGVDSRGYMLEYRKV